MALTPKLVLMFGELKAELVERHQEIERHWIVRKLAELETEVTRTIDADCTWEHRAQIYDRHRQSLADRVWELEAELDVLKIRLKALREELNED